jgi:hypothetical protein
MVKMCVSRDRSPATYNGLIAHIRFYFLFVVYLTTLSDYSVK